jgi:uroporphyrin-III C-methyltransferase
VSGRGIVYLVGAGPGDPELITVRGLRRLREAEVVIYDRLVHPDLLAEAPAGAERIDAGKAPGWMRGRRSGRPSASQEEIHALLVDRAQAGRTVVRLKGGDPFVFGRGGEELLACAAAGVPCEVVPGVTSAVGVPTAAGIPLTHRGLAASFAVVTAHRAADLDDVDWPALARADTLVVLMGVARLPYVTAALIRAGRPRATPAAIVERGTWEDERVVVGTLADLAARAAAAGVRSPATIVVGETVALAALPAVGLPDVADDLQVVVMVDPQEPEPLGGRQAAEDRVARPAAAG